jgi:hypothetical protein
MYPELSRRQGPVNVQPSLSLFQVASESPDGHTTVQSPGQLPAVSPQLQVPSPQWAVSTWVQLLVPLHERV